MATIEELCRAITTRQELAVSTVAGERIIHPHCVYRSTRDKVLLECWQVSGASDSGKVPWWKNLPIEQIVSLTPTGGTFEAAEGYNPTSMYHRTEVFCRL